MGLWLLYRSQSSIRGVWWNQIAWSRLAAAPGASKRIILRAWRAVLGLKRTPVYRVIGHMRYGPDWNHADPNEHPEARLARIKNSNAYRCIARIKSSRTYRFYASTKHSSKAR